MCEDEGAAAVAMHARTARQMYRGRADRARIADLKRHLSIPVVGNGDVETAADVQAMFTETGCDAVMAGRATMKNPWIFRQAADLLAGREPREATLEERRDLMLHHFGQIEAQGRAARGAPQAAHDDGLVHARLAQRPRPARQDLGACDARGLPRGRVGVLRVFGRVACRGHGVTRVSAETGMSGCLLSVRLKR